MKNVKKLFLFFLGCWLAAPTFAQQYPNRPIRQIVPAAPAGGTDITARSYQPALQEYLGQSVPTAAGIQPTN